MKFEIATTQAVIAGVAIGTSFAIASIACASPESGTQGIVTITAISIVALWQLRQ